MSKKIIKEIEITCLALIINIILLLLIILSHYEPCNAFFLIIIFIIPISIGIELNKIIPNILNLHQIIPTLILISTQFIINTYSLILLHYEEDKTTKQYKICTILIIINYILMALSIYGFLNIPDTCTIG